MAQNTRRFGWPKFPPLYRKKRMASSVVLGQSLANSIFTSGRNSAGSGQMHVKESVNC